MVCMYFKKFVFKIMFLNSWMFPYFYSDKSSKLFVCNNIKMFEWGLKHNNFSTAFEPTWKLLLSPASF